MEVIAQPPPHLSVCDVGDPLPDHGDATVYVTDRLQHLRGLLRGGLSWVDVAAISTLSAGTSVKDAIDVVANSAEPVPVLDDEKRLLGVISPRHLLLAMEAGS